MKIGKKILENILTTNKQHDIMYLSVENKSQVTVVKLANTLDLSSNDGYILWVRVPPVTFKRCVWVAPT